MVRLTMMLWSNAEEEEFIRHLINIVMQDYDYGMCDG